MQRKPDCPVQYASIAHCHSLRTREGGWGEVGAGVDTVIADNISLYATASYQNGFDLVIRSFGGNIGVRFTQ